MFSSESEPSLVLFSIFLKDLKIIIERKKKDDKREDGRKAGSFLLSECLLRGFGC